VTLSDWELWACARQQIVQHGDDAVVQAAMRSDALLAEGDLDGHRVWLAIVGCIHGLSSVTPDDTRR
jgi:hypothetical protein